MSKDPAFLFYPNDWLGGTMGMTFEEKGAYMDLLMMQFNRGHMTKHMIGQTIGQLWVNIEDKFEVDENGLYFNERLEEEKEKRKSFTESRRNNKSGKNQHSKDSKKSGHMIGHMIGHMEDVNEDENIIPSIEEYIKYAVEKKPDVDKQSVGFKCDAWVQNGWKDGNNKPVGNWKTKLLNTLPYLKERVIKKRGVQF